MQVFTLNFNLKSMFLCQFITELHRLSQGFMQAGNSNHLYARNCFCGALPLGKMTYLKPCFAASFKRSWPLGTGRISPESPTSPKLQAAEVRLLFANSKHMQVKQPSPNLFR